MSTPYNQDYDPLYPNHPPQLFYSRVMPYDWLLNAALRGLTAPLGAEIVSVQPDVGGQSTNFDQSHD